MEIITEIVTMKIADGMAKEEFIRIFNELENKFHSIQPGFVDSELLHNEKTDEWIVIQHWDSLENMQAASKLMFNNPITETYVKTIDPSSVKMIILPQLGVWGAKNK
ncbi:MAG: antibiotic biosynthesis monooxygenase [Lachnospiraceae bacterium]|nr:antibiotic biosynthesis monooxygenase [Lachnospiraceae bacterium]